MINLSGSAGSRFSGPLHVSVMTTRQSQVLVQGAPKGTTRNAACADCGDATLWARAAGWASDAVLARSLLGPARYRQLEGILTRCVKFAQGHPILVAR